MIPLIHITSPENALSIVHKKSYLSMKTPGSYDAGMNFLGVLGESGNTRPTRGAEIHCEWHGNVSAPLPFNAGNPQTKNLLFDFNGSGKYHINTDPRYFLCYGSTHLIVKKIVLEKEFNQASLVQWYALFKGGIFPFLHRYKFCFTYLLKRAINDLSTVNKQLTSQNVTISIQRGNPHSQ